MKKAALLACVVALVTSQARAEYQTYFEWQRSNGWSRAAYVAGAFDAYIDFSRDGIADHLNHCLYRNKISDVQLAENVNAFAVSHPDKQTLPVPALVVQYLVQLCGPQS